MWTCSYDTSAFWEVTPSHLKGRKSASERQIPLIIFLCPKSCIVHCDALNVSLAVMEVFLPRNRTRHMSRSICMDFVGGALSNVMFITGLLAIGIGLGIEFKIVEIKGQLNKQGRIGAIGIGLLLIVVSVVLYTRPQPTTSESTAPALSAPAQANLVGTPPIGGSAAQPTEPPAPTQLLSATPIPPTEAPTATPIPPTAVPGVSVPDIRKKNTKDAEKVLKEVGLRLGDQSESCDQISASPIDGKLKRDQIRCQSPAPGSLAAPNTPVLYVIGEDEKDD